MSLGAGLGLGLGQMWRDRAEFADLVQATEATGWDSLWFSEHLTGPTPAAMPQLAFAAALTERIRLGTSVTVVPGRSPVDLAKNLSTLNELSAGRLLPIFGLGTAEPNEHAAFGVARNDRARWLDQAMPAIRALLNGEHVDTSSDLFTLPGIGIGTSNPTLISSLWMGGRSERELRRASRLADGWLGSFAGPDETRQAVALIAEQSRRAGRSIDDDHYGLLLPYARRELPHQMRSLLATNYPQSKPSDLCPVGPEQLTDLLVAHVQAGISKFIIVPAEKPADWSRELPVLWHEVEVGLAAADMHKEMETV